MADITNNLLHNIQQIQQYSGLVASQLARRYGSDSPQIDLFKPLNNLVQDVISSAIKEPETIMADNVVYLQSLQEAWLKIADKNKTENSFQPLDWRFADKSWQDGGYFEFIHNCYELNANFIEKQADFYGKQSNSQPAINLLAKQIIAALAPTNFIASNPEVLKETIDSQFGNIVAGMKNFSQDLTHSTGFFSPATNDHKMFEIGRNIAATEGKVVYQNELMQLICYKPKTKTYARPIYIVPPWMNKFYILDLSKQNSLVKWLVDNNFQVFIISWVNPDKSYANVNFEDYCSKGVIAGFNEIKKLGYQDVNAVGYCIGGMLLTMTASLFAKKRQKFAANITLLTTLLDFAKPGKIGEFLCDPFLKFIKDDIKAKGYFDGAHLSSSFKLIKINELFWNYYINNYLLGKSPSAFDLLYWNDDTPNMPANMYLYYLENMYNNNNLIKKNKLKLLGQTIDLSAVKVPIFAVGARKDHITLWQGVYDSMGHIGSKNIVFCLTESGHVAGVVNPPRIKKYAHKIGQMQSDYDQFEKEAARHQYSWWLSWHQWLKTGSGKLQKSIDYKKVPSLEDAPGSYVLNKRPNDLK